MANIPKRILDSPAVHEWLRTQSEFRLEDFSDGPTAFNRSWRLENEHFVNAIRAVKDELPEEDREVAELFLLMPPRFIAQRLGITRKETYSRVRRMGHRALRLYKQRQQAPPRPKLPSPVPAPVRTVRFSAPGHKATSARLVIHDGEPVWIDAQDGVFPDEVQDMLSALPELESGFTVLDVEEKPRR